MYSNATDIFKNTIRSPSRTFKARLKINNKWIDSEFKKLNYETSSSADEYLQLGSTVSAKIELTISKVNELFENTEIPVEIGLKLPNGMYEYIPMGIFTAEHPKSTQDSTSFVAYDRMMKTTGVYVSNLNYPAAVQDVLKEISLGCGVPVDITGLNGITIDTKPVGYTYREALGYIASLVGGFACVDRTGTIVIKWYSDVDYKIDISRIMDFEKDESDYNLEKLSCNVDKSTTLTSGGGVLGVTFDNPFMTQSRLKNIFKKLSGFSYRGASVKTLGDIRLDPWDIITVEDGDGVYKMPVMNIQQVYDGGLSMTITSYGKTQTEQEVDFKGPTTQQNERIYSDLVLAKELIAKKVDADWVKANTVDADTIKSINNELQNIYNNYLKSNTADIRYANIDFTNIGKAAMEYFYAQSGLIKNVVVGDQTITGELIGVTIKGDLIEGNTIVADKLVIKGNDGLYYKLNTDGMHVEAEQTEYNSLDGSIIQAKSITATKIAVDDLVAFDATIAGFKITDEAIYSGAKSSALNNTRGIYLGKDGQLAFGDGNNYLKFYKDVSGNFKLAISASSMTFSSTGASVEDVIEDINDKVDSVVSVEKSDVTYQVGNSGTQKPSGEWTKSMPKANAGQFLWTRTLITYSDGSVTELFSVSLMGEKGDKGDKGDTGADAINVSITSSAGTVFKNNSGTTILTAHIYEGSEELTVAANGKCKLGLVKWYKGTILISVAGAVNVSAADVTNTQLYTCQLVDNGDVKASSQISIVDITDAYSVLLTSEAYTFAGNTSGAPAGQTCTTQIVAFCGQKSCTASVGNISCPIGITAAITNNNTISPIITFRTTANITASCEATIPVTIDKATINKKFSFAVAKSGANGTNGTNGNDGISSWTPVLTNVTRNGATFVKNNVGNGWGNAAFHSKEGYIDGCYVSCRSIYGSNFISLNADPATDASYTGLDYAWYMNSGTASVWINGKPIYNAGTYNEHTIFKIVYDGSTVKFYMDNTLHYSLARAKGVPLYADNSFYHNNARLEDVVFGPCGAKGDTGASGNGIASTAVAYQANSSGVTVPTGTWQASPPATSAAAPYMWTRITITYTNGTVTNSYSVGSTPEGISVGGRNLIIGSSKWTKDNPAKSTAAADGHVYIGGSALLEQGKTYTLQAVSDSIWSTSHNSATGTATIWLHGLNDGFHRVFTGDGKTNGRYIWTFTHTHPTQNCDIRINGYSKVTNFWNIKIESGNKATDWTPAPEDVDAKFNNYTTTEQLKADFKNTNSEFYSAISSSFATKVQLSKVDGKFSDYYSREDASTAIKQINNAISLKASLEEFHNGYRIIEAGGYGNDYRGTGAWLKINNIKQNIATGRGLSVTSINPTTLVANGSWSYDTFGSATARTNFKNKITELNSGDYIIVVVSSDAAYPSTVADALQLIGGTVYTGKSYREAYALIGKSRLGYGNGIEMYIPKTAEDKRNAVVSCYVSASGALMSSNSNSLYKKVTADLELKVGKNDNNQIVSMINASANEINLKANRFSLESDNLIITKDGKITKCKSINVTGGNIGRWNISDYLSSDNKDSYGYIRRAWMQPAANDETWVYSVQKSSNKNDASAFGGLWFVKGNGDQTTQNLNVNKNLTVYSDLTLYGKLTTDLKFRNYGKIINPYNQDLRFYASSEEQYALTFGVEYSASHSVITGWHFGPDAGGHIELGSARHPWYSIHADASLYVHSGSVYCYDYYYIWSNGGWVELSDWIKAKL